MINVIICDDNEKDKMNAEKITKKFMDKNKLEYKIHTCDDYNKSFELLTTLMSELNDYTGQIKTFIKNRLQDQFRNFKYTI